MRSTEGALGGGASGLTGGPFGATLLLRTKLNKEGIFMGFGRGFGGRFAGNCGPGTGPGCAMGFRGGMGSGRGLGPCGWGLAAGSQQAWVDQRLAYLQQEVARLEALKAAPQQEGNQ